MPVIAYDMPERFVAGTVGHPGERAFFLQAKAGARVTSVGLEKFQVALLAQRLEELLDEVEASTVVLPDADDGPLDQPVEEEFRVGAMALAWDSDDERVIIEAQEVNDDSEEVEVGELDPAQVVLRVRLSAEMARSFAARALRVVAAGRPPCPLCGLPLDAAGHTCPRQNGHLG